MEPSQESGLSPVRCEVIGRRQSEDRSTLAFILQCQSGKALWRGTSQPVYRTVEDFCQLHSDLSR